MLSVLRELSRTVVATEAFTGLRAGEIRGLTWDAYSPGDGTSLGAVRVLRSVWRGRVGEPKKTRSKVPVHLIPQLEAQLDRHRVLNGNPSSGPIFANCVGKALDLDCFYRREMKDRLSAAKIDWESWHGFRRGLATNLERIGVRDSIAAMRQLSETLSALPKPQLLPNCSPKGPKESVGTAETVGFNDTQGDVNAYD